MKKYLLCHTNGYMDGWLYTEEGDQFCTAFQQYEVIDEIELEQGVFYRIIDDEGDEHEFVDPHLRTWFTIIEKEHLNDERV